MYSFFLISRLIIISASNSDIYMFRSRLKFLKSFLVAPTLSNPPYNVLMILNALTGPTFKALNALTACYCI
ncbi:hypothetical protein Hanom_Chr08g00744681 [Helianthus anomalus]